MQCPGRRFESPQMKSIVQHNLCNYLCLQQANTSAYTYWFPQTLYSFLFYMHAVALADWQPVCIDVVVVCCNQFNKAVS